MNMIAFRGGRAGGDTKDTAGRYINQFKTHSHVDQRGAYLLKLGYDNFLVVTCIYRDEGESYPIKKFHVDGPEIDFVKESP